MAAPLFTANIPDTFQRNASIFEGFPVILYAARQWKDLARSDLSAPPIARDYPSRHREKLRDLIVDESRTRPNTRENPGEPECDQYTLTAGVGTALSRPDWPVY